MKNSRAHWVGTGCASRKKAAGPILAPVRSVKDDGLVPVHQDAAFQMPRNRLGQHLSFQLATLPDKVLHPMTMRDARHVLMDDRAFIEIAGGVVRRGTDELHPAFMGLVIRAAAGEGRE